MTTPSTYAHFENAVPCGDNGLAVGAMGSEVTVCDSNGRLYSAGTAMFYNAGSAADLRIATGTATLDDATADITTGLTTIVAAIATRKCSQARTAITNSLDPVLFMCTHVGGTLRINGFRLSHAQGAGSPAPICNTNSKAASVDWIAIGT
jgi:hypothetical protein